MADCWVNADEHRLRIVWIPEGILLGVFQMLSKVETCVGSRIEIPKIPSLPDGYKVLQVHYAWDRRCFGFLIQHPSFDVVLPGNMVPIHHPFATTIESVWAEVSIEPNCIVE